MLSALARTTKKKRVSQVQEVRKGAQAGEAAAVNAWESETGDECGDTETHSAASPDCEVQGKR